MDAHDMRAQTAPQMNSLAAALGVVCCGDSTCIAKLKASWVILRPALAGVKRTRLPIKMDCFF